MSSSLRFRQIARSILESASGPGATGTRIIHTPWPFTIGLTVASIISTYLSARTMAGAVRSAQTGCDILGYTIDTQVADKKLKRNYVIYWITYIFNLIWVFGAIVCHIIDIKNGATIPSVGTMVNMIAATASSTPIQESRANPRCYIGYTITAIGFVLYTVRGGLSIRRRGFKSPSFDISVTQGCPSGTFSDFVESYLCAAPQPYNFPYSSKEDQYITICWFFGLGFGILVIWNIISRYSKRRIWIKLAFSNLALILALLGGGLANVPPAIDSGPVTVDYDDCRNAQQQSDGYWNGCVASQIIFAGSVSGFWTTWAQNKLAVARAVFAW